MPDITMCKNDKCPLGVSCYRYNATPSQYQSYAMFEPAIDEELDEIECKMFLFFCL
jgi:hypothetical protein